MNIPVESKWKGARGEWYVVAQMALFALVIFGPRSVTAWPRPYSGFALLAGALLMVEGVLLAATGTVNLGRNLTPLPRPKDDTELVMTGAYRLVRHPIYSGLISMGFGWGLWVQSWLTLGYALLLYLFFEIKSNREERWLMEKFPEYAAYRQRVKKLIPFVR
ncbi:putative protein [Geobacter sp. OR-1]|uniref:methyltransferase family protein n=1 Tax=Geobacter sp. OR-1 TaxID=1266765 RepID=UPI0005434650|nr:isoprenylcysteine carboxylmethyltransferase family protein [Geobacter sp. OR-1]GAM11357.1 putative protein [Geobacter sp. OR-1]